MGDYLHTRTGSADLSSTELSNTSESIALPKPSIVNYQLSIANLSEAKGFGQLVVLGFDVAVFTPAPYQRHRL